MRSRRAGNRGWSMDKLIKPALESRTSNSRAVPSHWAAVGAHHLGVVRGRR
ncbi:hypothetical protein [Microtetraspora malaysiensis]|uniref:hypothetical protein n=1 Tax=Microtetraspora malaysiensis TaxID=161358 RepID=UPI003D911D2C